eukprot:5959590-Pyramimonas_sp.AAC.1
MSLQPRCQDFDDRPCESAPRSCVAPDGCIPVRLAFIRLLSRARPRATTPRKMQGQSNGPITCAPFPRQQCSN